jgi:hypothetical protein
MSFIGRTVSLHVSAHRVIIRRYINKPYTIELWLLYGFIYCTYHMSELFWKTITDYSNSSNAEVKNLRSYTAATPYIFMMSCFIKHCDNIIQLHGFKPMNRQFPTVSQEITVHYSTVCWCQMWFTGTAKSHILITWQTNQPFSHSLISVAI